ncbi:hypothetical protein I546_3665 [Mycobacterium kansasii 732]|nr:hypothetical protein I546_3665 [Mycobacterium kansasii 732]
MPIRANSPPTWTTSSSSAVMLTRTPATGDGISVSTLSVETSTSGSSTPTESPIFFSQRVTVPSVTDSPSSGIKTGVVSPAEADGWAGSDTARGSGSVSGAGWACGAGSALPEPEASGSGWAGFWSPPLSDVSPMMASSPPTSTVSSSWAMILVSTPAAGEGISVSTLSVDTSTRGSSISTVSPSCLSQRVTVPSVTLSPSAGIWTEKAISVDSSIGRRSAQADLWLTTQSYTGCGTQVDVETYPVTAARPPRIQGAAPSGSNGDRAALATVWPLVGEASPR